MGCKHGWKVQFAKPPWFTLMTSAWVQSSVLPTRLTSAQFLKPGANKVRIEVANTAHELHGRAQPAGLSIAQLAIR